MYLKIVSIKHGSGRKVYKMPITDDCWYYLGYKNPRHGYGRYNGISVHRLSYEIHKGPIGDLLVCHKCDNPPCINPDHLFLGTVKDNFDDMRRKGRERHRSKPGEDHGMHKLTYKQVDEIRAKYKPRQYTMQMLMEEYGVSNGCIQKIIYRENWRSKGE